MPNVTTCVITWQLSLTTYGNKYIAVHELVIERVRLVSDRDMCGALLSECLILFEIYSKTTHTITCTCGSIVHMERCF